MPTLDEYEQQLDQYAKLLPAWFVPRMLGDTWSFALLTTNRLAILINTITAVHQAADGSIWIDVDLTENPSVWTDTLRDMSLHILCAPTSRTTASINAAHIVAAFEIADT